MNVKAVFGFILGSVLASGVMAADCVWVANGGGAWSDTANWRNGTLPQAGDTVFFTNVTPGVVSLPTQSVTSVGHLTFHPAFAGTWTLTGGALKLKPSTVTPSIVISESTVVFRSPVLAEYGLIKRPASINRSNNGTLAFYNTVSSTGRIDTQSGTIIVQPQPEALVAEQPVWSNSYVTAGSIMQCGSFQFDGVPGRAASSSTWNLTLDATLVTKVSTQTTTVTVGQLVSGTGIPAGTFVRKILSDDAFELSAAATATGSGVTLSFAAYWPRTVIQLPYFKLHFADNREGFGQTFALSSTNVTVIVDQLVNGNVLLNSGTGTLIVSNSTATVSAFTPQSGSFVAIGAAAAGGATSTFKRGEIAGSTSCYQFETTVNDISLTVSSNAIFDVDSFSGTRTATISGGGKTIVRNQALVDNKLVLKEGTIELVGTEPGSAAVPASDPTTNAYFHLDASVASSFTLDGGTNVVEWRDLNYATSGLKAVAQREVAAVGGLDTYPLYSALGFNNKPVVDFGAVGSGRLLLWNHTNTQIRSVIIVYPYLARTLSAFLLGDASANAYPGGGSVPLSFHRGNNGRAFYQTGSSFYSQPIYVNGLRISDQAQFILPTTPTVFSAVTPGAAGTASAFAVDRWNVTAKPGRSGGMKFCEVLIYTNTLSATERADIEAWLMKKWFNQPAPGYRLDPNSRVGMTELAVQASGEFGVSVYGEGDVTIDRVSGKGTLVKRGPGSLKVGSLASLQNQTVKIEGGSFSTGGGTRPIPSAARLPSGIAFRVDASDLATLTLEDSAVVAIRDADGRANQAVATNASIRPTWVANALNGKGVIDFGAYGSGKFLVWSNQLSTIRTVFWVIDSAQGGGFLLGATNAASCDFHRGVDFTTRLGKIWSSAYGSPRVYQGSTRVNGMAVNGAAIPLGGTFELISLVTTDITTAGLFAADRAFLDRTGGQRLAEVIVYTRALTDAEVLDVEAYLSDKWFNQKPGAYAGGVTEPVNSAQMSGLSTIASSDTVVGEISGSWTKTNAGVVRAGRLTGSVSVQAGGIQIEGAHPADVPVTAGRVYHMDPSRAETMLLAANTVTTLYSIASDHVNTARPYVGTGFSGPLLLTNQLNGLPVLDCGVLGSKRHLITEVQERTVRDIYMIFGSQNGGGFLLGNRGLTNLVDGTNSERFFHRNTGTAWGGTFPQSMTNCAVAIFNAYAEQNRIADTGYFRTNNVVMAPRSAGFSGGYQLIDIQASGVLWFAGFGYDRQFDSATGQLTYFFNDGSRMGGQRYGEVIMYDRNLTAEERTAVYNYLNWKWFNAAVPGYKGSSVLDSVSVAANAWIDLAGESLTAKSVAGAGEIRNGTVRVGESLGPSGALTVSNLTVQAQTIYHAQPGASIQVQDTLSIEGPLTVQFTLANGMLPPAEGITLFSFATLAHAAQVNLAQWTLSGEVSAAFYPRLEVQSNAIRLIFKSKGTLLMVR